MKFGNKTLISCVVFGALVLCSCSHDKQERQTAPVRVETLTLVETPVTEGRSYSGVIEESSGTVLSFKIPGTLTKLAVQEGQFVSKGQFIGEVDASSLESNLRIAEATLATAQDTYDRMKMLHDASAITDMKWVEVENSLKSAKSAAQIARNTLNDSKIYAPTSGYVSKKIADVGNTMAPGVPVVNLVEINPVKISISVSEDEIASISNDTEAYITVGALENFAAVAKLSDKGIVADPLSRTYTIKFSCPNPDKKMLPGMLCNVTLSINQTQQAMVVPVNAVLLDANNQCFVWLEEDGKSVKRLVTLGDYTNNGVIIKSGLSLGDKVIVKGMQKISEGMGVESINK
ncbi:MAG: efflux RND transporter periplasmic adaptor subunit [Muribaculaceae bacterium]|nr:efflux RND transporter periplasmic adaptor subunit [Muribaculaceae bacterium]